MNVTIALEDNITQLYIIFVFMSLLWLFRSRTTPNNYRLEGANKGRAKHKYDQNHNGYVK